MVQTRFNRTGHSVADLILFCQKEAYFSEYLAYLDWCFYVGSRVVEILLLFIRCWTRTLTEILQLSFTPNIFRSEDFIILACRSNRKCHHHLISFTELGHLLTRSGLTYHPEVSLNVYHDSFCQLESSISLPWVIYFEAFYLHVVSSFYVFQ